MPNAIYVLLSAVLLLTAACSHPDVSDSRLRLSPDTLVSLQTNAQGQTILRARFVVPRSLVSRRQRLVVVPQLVAGDTVLCELSPLVADRTMYTRKLHRREVLNGFHDFYASPAALRFNHKAMALLNYADTLQLPSSRLKAHLQAVATTDGCGSCTAFDTIQLGEVNNLVARLPQELCQLIERPFTIRPKVVKGSGEARLQFVVDKWDILPSMGRNQAELDSMKARLQPVLTDTLATLNSLTIQGAASAEGTYKHNVMLATNRAASARQWLMEQLNLPKRYLQKLKVSAKPEGWEPVVAAMTQAGCADSAAVRQILNRFPGENDDVPERYIRRLKCWPDIREHYLAKDRRVTYTYSYTIRNFRTDDEILRLFTVRPDAFNEEEMLHVVKLLPSVAQQQEAYRKVLRYFPSSEVAANNLAVMLLRDNKAEEAAKVAASIPEAQRSDTLCCSLAYALAAQARYAEARKVLAASSQTACVKQALQAIGRME